MPQEQIQPLQMRPPGILRSRSTLRWSHAASPRLAAVTGPIPRAQQPLQTLPRGKSWKSPAAQERQGLSSAHAPGNKRPVGLEKLRQKLPGLGLCRAFSLLKTLSFLQDLQQNQKLSPAKLLLVPAPHQ